MITQLKENEIFVFGSNEAGIHGAGAAKQAYEQFGAIWGVGFGPQGQTFAIPTKDWNIKTLGLIYIYTYVKRFIDYARNKSELKFLVTEIGCGLAGYTPEDIALAFKNVVYMRISNIILPESFVKIIEANYDPT